MPVKPTADTQMRVFELPDMAKILAVDFAKLKNWTNGRTGLVITPSVRPAGGTGKSNLYSVTDLYLMAVAREFSKAGFAANAIGKLTEAALAKLSRPYSPEDVWTIMRAKGGGPFTIQAGDIKPVGLFWQTLRLGELIAEVESAIEAFAAVRKRELEKRKKEREEKKRAKARQ